MFKALPLLFLSLVLMLNVSGCRSLPREAGARRQVYEQRLRGLSFPTTRERLYRVLRPAGPPVRSDALPGNVLSGQETYRLDADFVVELTVIYKAVVRANDFLNPSRSLFGQMRALMDTTTSIDNMVNLGTPNYPGDIVDKARIRYQPSRAY